VNDFKTEVMNKEGEYSLLRRRLDEGQPALDELRRQVEAKIETEIGPMDEEEYLLLREQVDARQLGLDEVRRQVEDEIENEREVKCQMELLLKKIFEYSSQSIINQCRSVRYVREVERLLQQCKEQCDRYQCARDLKKYPLISRCFDYFQKTCSDRIDDVDECSEKEAVMYSIASLQMEMEDNDFFEKVESQCLQVGKNS
jgi:hypothetical protein